MVDQNNYYRATVNGLYFYGAGFIVFDIIALCFQVLVFVLETAGHVIGFSFGKVLWPLTRWAFRNLIKPGARKAFSYIQGVIA